uniref:Uncharacterized protein n=1 Tax=Human herpesvirus 1 TaxID=10298 RepID=A0A2Z4H8P7_HHV1|nr:hypothetical protein [Human alphaherpesvirus 1]
MAGAAHIYAGSRPAPGAGPPSEGGTGQSAAASAVGPGQPASAESSGPGPLGGSCRPVGRAAHFPVW